MNHAATVGLAAAVVAVALLVLTAATAPVLPNGHRPLHINCPPGSHVARSSLNFGPALQRARAQSMAARSVTAGHPNFLAYQPNAPK